MSIVFRSTQVPKSCFSLLKVSRSVLRNKPKTVLSMKLKTNHLLMFQNEFRTEVIYHSREEYLKRGPKDIV